MLEDEPSVYLYRLRMGGHTQTGLAACFSLDEYDRDIIKKHERTRRDKEDDRTRHMLALGAQTGPVFLTYRASADVDRSRRSRDRGGCRCSTSTRPTACTTRCGASAAPIATRWSRRSAGFRRCTSPTDIIAPRARPARARHARHGPPARSATAPITTFLAVAFPHDQVQILPYNRIVKDLGGLAPDDFLEAVRERFEVDAGPASPRAARRHRDVLPGRLAHAAPRVPARCVRSDRIARRQRAAGPAAGARAEDRGRSHRQAD